MVPALSAVINHLIFRLCLINLLAKESVDEDIVTFFGVANALHRNFYENEMPEETVKISAKDNNKLTRK